MGKKCPRCVGYRTFFFGDNLYFTRDILKAKWVPKDLQSVDCESLAPTQ